MKTAVLKLDLITFLVAKLMLTLVVLVTLAMRVVTVYRLIKLRQQASGVCDALGDVAD